MSMLKCSPVFDRGLEAAWALGRESIPDAGCHDMNAHSGNHARATIVMAARERHALAEAAIESIVSETRRSYRFIYLDVQSPDWLRTTLALRAKEWGLEVVRFDEPLWPHEARKRVIRTIDTDYVIFIDNDVQVS